MSIKKESHFTWMTGIVIIAVISAIFFHPWTALYNESLISWDKLGYYLYLPTFFIYKDWHHFSFMNEYFPAYQPSSTWYATLETPDLGHVITYPIGVSYFQLPFFLLGHLSACVFDYAKDGFSKPYVFWIYISGLFYTILGLYYTLKNLSFFYSIKISGTVVILLMLSTNLFYYGFVDNIMPHSYSFFLISLMLYYTIKWHERQTFKRALIICLSIGFMFSIRVTDAIVALIPLFYGVINREGLRNKLLIVKNNFGSIFVAVLIGLIPFLIQMFYWHFATGYWLFNTYSYAYQGFGWAKPHITDFLISYRKGWLIYTPVMIFSLAGFYFMRNSNLKKLLPGLVIFLIIDLYILSSWNQWWFGGSFGQRSMVQAYALLVIPFAASVVSLSNFRFIRKGIVVFVCICLFLNLLFSWAYKNSLMLTDGMTKEMFLEVLRNPTSAYIPESKRIHSMQWKDEFVESENEIARDTAVRTMENGNFSGILEQKSENIKRLSSKWIRCKFETQFQPSNNLFPNSLHVVFDVKSSDGKSRFWKGKLFTDQFGDKNKMSEWIERTVDFRVPENLKSDYSCLFYFWLTEVETVNIKNLRVYNIQVRE